MPLADRDPLRAAEARVCELERQLDAAKRECVVVERDRRYWAGRRADAPAQAEQHAAVGRFFGQDPSPAPTATIQVKAMA
jgi:hypothetical protein